MPDTKNTRQVSASIPVELDRRLERQAEARVVGKGLLIQRGIEQLVGRLEAQGDPLGSQDGVGVDPEGARSVDPG